MHERRLTELTVSAVTMAIRNRQPDGGLIHYFGHRSVYGGSF